VREREKEGGREEGRRERRGERERKGAMIRKWILYVTRAAIYYKQDCSQTNPTANY
jgi:hypothetical protein